MLPEVTYHTKIDWLTDSMEQSPWEPYSHSTNQEILCLLWNLQVHNHIHKSPPLVPILSKIDPVHILQTSFCQIHSSIILLSVSRYSEWCLPFRFSNHLSPSFMLHDLPTSSSSTWLPQQYLVNLFMAQNINHINIHNIFLKYYFYYNVYLTNDNGNVRCPSTCSTRWRSWIVIRYCDIFI